MLSNHAPIVSTLSSGVIKIKGDVNVPDGLNDLFSQISSKEIHFKSKPWGCRNERQQNYYTY